MTGWRYGAAALTAAALALASCASAGPPATSGAGDGRGSTQLRVERPAGRAAAVRAVDAALAAAPVPPGSRAAAHVIGGLDAPFSATASPHQVMRTRWFRVPRTVAATLAYVRAHPPAGTRFGSSGSSGGGGAATISSLEYEGAGQLSVQYSATRLGRAAAALRVDAITIWVPARPHWSYLPASVDSVRVVVVRLNPQLHRSAPTVRRTLRGAAAAALVRAVDRRAVAPDYGVRSCPAMLSGEVWGDALTFRAGRRSYLVVEELAGCGYLRLSQGRRSVLLDGSLDPAVLAALRLPANYGS